MKRNCVRTCMESSLFFSLTREMVGNNHHIFFFNRPLRVKKSRLFFFILIALIRVFKGTLHTTEARESVVCVVDGAHWNAIAFFFFNSLFFFVCLFQSYETTSCFFFYFTVFHHLFFFFLILNKKKKPIHMHIIYISVFFYRRSGCFGLFFFFCSPVSIRVHTLATSHCCKASTLFFFCFDLSPLPYVPCQKRKAKRQVTRLSSVVQMSWWDWVVWRWKQSPRIQINIHLPWIMIPSELRCKGFTAHSRVIFLFNERIQLNESYSARNDSFASANHVKNTHIFFF